MATGNYVFDEVDDHEEYLVVLAKEAKEAILDRKVKEMQKKNRDILKRHAEVEADRKAAEDSGCAVNLKSNTQQSQSDHCEMQTEAPKLAEEDRHRGQGQGRGRGRPRASRFRPGHYGEGSMRDNHVTESDLLEGKDSEKRLSPSYSGMERQLPTGDWDTGPPPSHSSASHPLESQPPNGGQRSRESSRGQRVMPGRGHSRGPFAKFVTVPDASHSHDVRHVEEVNNSIVINIDRSNRLGGGESTRRGGGGGRGGGSGYSMQHNPTGELLEDSTNVRDQEPSSDHALHHQGHGRRPFRGRGDGSFRGRGEGSFRGQGRGEKFRRGRGDGPRPFRGGYRADRPRGGRASRRAVIVTSKSERADSAQQVQESEDWDKMIPADAAAAEAGAATDGHGWTNTEDGSASWDKGEGIHDPEKGEVMESGHFCKELDLNEGEEVTNQDQPEKLHHHTVEQSESNSDRVGDQPIAGLASKDESISTQAEHSASCAKPPVTLSALPVDTTEGDLEIHEVEKLTEKPRETLSALPVETTKVGLGGSDVEKITEKPPETLSALPVEATKVGLGVSDVEKITEKPPETLSALPVEATKVGLGVHDVKKITENSSSNTETNVKPHELNTIAKAAEVENPSSRDHVSCDLVPEKVAEAANGESKYAIKSCNVEVAGLVNLSSTKSNSLALAPDNDVSTDLKRPDHEMSSSMPVPSVSVAAAAFDVMSIQPESPANVLTGESISIDPQSSESGLMEKSAVSSEIPESVKEKT